MTKRLPEVERAYRWIKRQQQIRIQYQSQDPRTCPYRGMFCVECPDADMLPCVLDAEAGAVLYDCNVIVGHTASGQRIFQRCEQDCACKHAPDERRTAAFSRWAKRHDQAGDMWTRKRQEAK